MTGESHWIERAQTAEARLRLAEGAIAPLKDKVRAVMDTLGARELSDGSFDIDYEKLVERLGLDGALVLRKVIDERYGISGAAGDKPRVKVRAVTDKSAAA